MNINFGNEDDLDDAVIDDDLHITENSLTYELQTCYPPKNQTPETQNSGVLFILKKSCLQEMMKYTLLFRHVMMME